MDDKIQKVDRLKIKNKTVLEHKLTGLRMEVDGLLEELICDESGRSCPISKSEYERYFLL